MMKDNSDNLKEITDCPSIKELNAFYDGEMCDSEFIAHFQSCSTCQDIINTYREIDDAIDNNSKVNNLQFSVMRGQIPVEN